MGYSLPARPVQQTSFASSLAAPLLLWGALIVVSFVVGWSLHALFMGVGAWGVAALVVAATDQGLRAGAAALVGGLLLGAACFLSFGLVLLVPVAASVAVWRGRWRLLLVALAAVAAVEAAFGAAGFWWFDGLAATMIRYAAGVSSFRPTSYF